MWVIARSSKLGRQVFRQGSFMLALAVILIPFPVYHLCAQSLPHLLGVRPRMLRAGSYSDAFYEATTAHVVGEAFVMLALITVGVYALLYYFFAVVVVDKNGIVAYNAFGRERFRLLWSHIHSVQTNTTVAKGGTISKSFEIHSHGSVYKIGYGYEGNGGLTSAFKRHLPYDRIG